MKQKIEKRALLKDERGLTTVEYIIILCLIAIVGFAVWKKFGETVKTRVNESDQTLNMMSGLSME
ncbi:MAG: hypothetical protein NZ898_13670 [Myxococcota bacterium]|nr:hypothetical protein [Myxococcota bacterium]MDW8361072.1 hypothetical protein [Myxococcales bacterium]